MLADTPTVDHDRPAPSALSIMTRVTASVPAPMIRTRKSASAMSSIDPCHGPRSLASAAHSAWTGPRSPPSASAPSLADITVPASVRTVTTASATEIRRPTAFNRRSTVTR